jgi:hypothetical protein
VAVEVADGEAIDAEEATTEGAIHAEGATTEEATAEEAGCDAADERGAEVETTLPWAGA